jgi:hypothetical protein
VVRQRWRLIACSSILSFVRSVSVCCPRTLVLQDVEADASDTINVGMVDLGQEMHLGRDHRIVLRQEQLQAKLAAGEAAVLQESNRRQTQEWKQQRRRSD